MCLINWGLYTAQSISTNAKISRLRTTTDGQITSFAMCNGSTMTYGSTLLAETYDVTATVMVSGSQVVIDGQGILDFSVYAPNTTSVIINGVQTNFIQAGNYVESLSISHSRNWSGSAIINSGIALNLNNGACLTVNSGAVLTISPNVLIACSNGASIIVNGTLNAIGTSSDSIHFERAGTGSWGGIQFNAGSSGTIQYCCINNAVNGISVYNTTINPIAYNRISNCSGDGIYCYSTSGLIHHNKIYGANYGLYFDHYSTPVLGIPAQSLPGPGGNIIANNKVGMMASGSTPILGIASASMAGYNSIYSNTNQDFVVAGCGTVWAQNNWWNGSPKLVVLYSTLNYTPMLTDNPNPSMMIAGGSSIAALGSTTPTLNTKIVHDGTSTTDVDTRTSSGDADLSKLLLSELNGIYDEAIPGYLQKLKTDTSTITRKYCLARLSDCYTKGAKTDFSTFLDANIRSSINVTDELYAATLEVESIHFVQGGSHDKALENYKTLIKTFSKNDDVYKHALFNAGYLCYHQLKDTANGKKYFAQLKAHFPDDELTVNALQMHGLTKMLSDSQTVKQLANEASGTGLVGNYPNPFNPTTTISYQLQIQSRVSLKIYDVLGREIATLVNSDQPAGTYNATFDGSRFASGIYFARFMVSPASGKQIMQVKKMLMIK